MDFGKTLSRAWQIVWKNRVLWIFGILASCGSGGGGGGGSSNFNAGGNTGGELPPEMQRFAAQIERFFENAPETIVPWIIALVCAVLLLSLMIWAIGVFGRVGVIRGAILADGGKSFSFGSLVRESWARLGGALWMNFLLGLIPAAVAILLAIMAFVAVAAVSGADVGGMGFLGLCFIPIFCVLVPFFIAYSVYIQVANVAYVHDGLSATDAIRKGWDVFRNNVGNIVILALILFVGGLLVGIVLALPFIAIAAPALIGFAGGGDSLNTGLIISGICLVIALPVLIVANGILQAFIHSSWTLAYSQMSTKKPVKRKTSTS
jgi:hypothetical protein